MDAASAETPPIVLAPASQPSLDPRQVITPLIASKLEETLHKFGIYKDWMHIISNIRNGFDVGVSGTPTATLIF